MKISSEHEAQNQIAAYMKSANKNPYFVAADGDEYCNIKDKLTKQLSTIRVGSFCSDDNFPDFDELTNTLKTAEKNLLCLGLGEAVLLSNKTQVVERIRGTFCNEKIIILCRGLKKILIDLADDSPKFRRNLCVVEAAQNFSVVQYRSDLGIEVAVKNFYKLLTKLEDGACGQVEVQSKLPLSNVQVFTAAYDAIKFKNPAFNALREVLSDEQWNEFLADNSTTAAPNHWRYYLRGFLGGMENRWLKFVFDNSADFKTYAKNIFLALIKIDKDDKNFREFYRLRKAIVKNLDEKFLPEYISAAQRKGVDAIYYLTDNTMQEISAAINAIQGVKKIPAAFKENFAALGKYLTDYKFSYVRLTNYFRRYKKIKLCNLDDAQFKADVENYARERIYNNFETRRTILDRLDKNAKLYWLDGLGVEFLGYIERLAEESGLAIKIHVARAELPTLTAFNKSFFEEWQGVKFPKNQQLDDLKHSPEDKNSPAPLYICEELSIIADAVATIKNSLQTNEASKVILTSDHGASRLAVTYRGETFAMTNSGEHGGRCCKNDNRDEKPDCVTSANGYFVAANYARFKGGRLDSVEVHGGATFEEVLIPVIEISLREEKSCRISR